MFKMFGKNVEFVLELVSYSVETRAIIIFEKYLPIQLHSFVDRANPKRPYALWFGPTLR